MDSTPPTSLTKTQRDTLVTDHLGYVRALARKLQREMAQKAEFDELVAYGSRGLMEAAERFDPTRGVAFTTFSYYRIRGAMIDGLRESGWVKRQRGKFAAGANAYMENRLARGEAQGTNLEQQVGSLAQQVQDIATIFVTSLDQEGQREQADHKIPDGLTVAETREACQAVRDALQDLPDKERQLLEMFYYQGLTLQDAGKKMGLSKSWASRLHSRAVRLLSTRLQEHAPDSLSSLK